MAVIDIKLDRLKIHPNNIRKEYDGIEELAQSIKENGIMQNLTVVPDKNEEGTYFVVIGNRRLTAARQAGIETAPCIIVDDMSDKDQITTMLTENMNRKDLKFYEEAAAVQMCMKDFGFDIEEMEKKTGLSKTTLHHRLNLAKLDQKQLQKLAKDENFQLTLSDLYALEKLDDIKVRNKILKEARDSRDLLNRARYAENDQTRDRNAKVIIELCTKRGIAAAPKSAENELYSGKWNTVNSYDLLEKPPKQLKLKDGELFHCIRYGRLYILEKTAKAEKKKLTKEEIKAKEREKLRREIGAKYKTMFEDMGDFIRKIIDGKVPMVENTELLDLMIWNHLLEEDLWISRRDIVSTLLGAEYWSNKVENDQRVAAEKKAPTIPLIMQKLAIAYWHMKDLNLVDYLGEYNIRSGKKLQRFYKILEPFGYSWPDDESRQIADGTSEKYVKQQKEN